MPSLMVLLPYTADARILRQNACYKGNRSEASFNDNIKLADPQNPIGTRISELSLRETEL